MKHVSKESRLPQSVFFDLRGNHDRVGVPNRELDFFSWYSISADMNRVGRSCSSGNCHDSLKMESLLEGFEKKQSRSSSAKVAFGHFPMSFTASSESGRRGILIHTKFANHVWASGGALAERTSFGSGKSRTGELSLDRIRAVFSKGADYCCELVWRRLNIYVSDCVSLDRLKDIGGVRRVSGLCGTQKQITDVVQYIEERLDEVWKRFKPRDVPKNSKMRLQVRIKHRVGASIHQENEFERFLALLSNRQVMSSSSATYRPYTGGSSYGVWKRKRTRPMASDGRFNVTSAQIEEPEEAIDLVRWRGINETSPRKIFGSVRRSGMVYDCLISTYNLRFRCWQDYNVLRDKFLPSQNSRWMAAEAMRNVLAIKGELQRIARVTEDAIGDTLTGFRLDELR
ncbi:hypothetical protein SELMODRAFT_448077 [Selaginella moellendorffii]|uniref:Uncharacterized protein n=1 Tax=Selaginella moellendorffii TaxID=88036 RepID=D8T4M4_SELML|nr:hypothetical protein SELMODRAFT_448077 [Selaginella moellendorffii]